MKFKVDESFKIRHSILEYLYKQQSAEGNHLPKRYGSIELATNTNISIEKIHRYHEILKKDDEIDCCETDNQHKMFIKDMGRYSYLENKYHKLGWFDLWEYWFQPLKVLIPFIAIIVSVAAIIINYKQSHKVEQLSNKINLLEQKIEARNNNMESILSKDK